MDATIKRFRDFFASATGWPDAMPYPYQERLACVSEWPELLDVPTGLGKTAAVVLGWLFRRQDDALRPNTPRRLVYCLPMRTLVEQTAGEAERWIANLKLTESVGVHILMGGVETASWDEQPERDQILVGTQDMLLSRALNRGFAMSRFRWPIPFALLNNDCLWVLDETQLMGVGVSTAAQLAGLRRKLGACGPTHTLWASATLDPKAVWTVDHPRPDGDANAHRLSDDERELPRVKKLLLAEKPLKRAEAALSKEVLKSSQYAKALAAEIVAAHREGTLTLAVLNTVDRARDVFRQLEKKNFASSEGSPELALIHSRFRGVDRAKHQAVLLRDEQLDAGGPGRIVIATQAVEAGVDVSAATLFTELAPWSSLVQRFGRCNRRGEYPEDRRDGDGNPIAARVLWIDIDTGEDKPTDEVMPYSKPDLDVSRERLEALADVGPTTLQDVAYDPRSEPAPHLRRKDLLELWDTTPALSGHDIDVSRFIRDADDVDVRFYWRDWDGAAKGAAPPADKKAFRTPAREEMCAVRIGRAKDFLKKLVKLKRPGSVWDHLGRKWEPLRDAADLIPGMTVLLPEAAGGYSARYGWTGDPKTTFDGPRREPDDAAVQAAETATQEEANNQAAPILLADHTNRVVRAVEQMKAELPTVTPALWELLIEAARQHDWGKAHEAFQRMLRGGTDEQYEQYELLAKSWSADPASDGSRDADSTVADKNGAGRSSGPRYVASRNRDGQPPFDERVCFRHELASAVAYLQSHDFADDPDRNLIAYLIAAHHGKVRAGLRSLPEETRPADGSVKFARGVWDGDVLPAADLGGEIRTEPITLELGLMSLGGFDRGGEPVRSWAARVSALRDDERLGPFRLAFLEMLLRVADWRGSREETNHA